MSLKNESPEEKRQNGRVHVSIFISMDEHWETAYWPTFNTSSRPLIPESSIFSQSIPCLMMTHLHVDFLVSCCRDASPEQSWSPDPAKGLPAHWSFPGTTGATPYNGSRVERTLATCPSLRSRLVLGNRQSPPQLFRKNTQTMRKCLSAKTGDDDVCRSRSWQSPQSLTVPPNRALVR